MKEDPYKNWARKYDFFVEPFNKTLRQIGIGLHPPVAGMNILDIGCGTGTTLNHYKNEGCNVFGIDSSPSMLSVAKTRLGGRANLLLGDASNMEYPNNFFDMVIAMMTLHEIFHTARLKVFDEMMRVLKKDGRILIIDYHPSDLIFPKGWMHKSVIFFFEIMAGSEHFKNFRDFIASDGIPGIVENRDIDIEKSKIVSSGNLGIFLLCEK
ncbi:methyltransferase domain-containing protein [uncultured Desulfosarcina sp.]|uniref:class I SAM-dependent methyltransferase n=1 Tax=uncultured Desulfosarcina sp. TaxID=218289 RepID=UPI0029C7A4FD|nr:methyltransferase domain-containing protein [uncultured Desulfosarcina sp.]